MTSKIEIKKSGIHGKGIFTKKNIKKGEIVFIIKGKLVKFEVHNKKESSKGPNWVGISKNTWINPFEPAKNLNHSCNPSCGIKGKVQIIALRNLKAGEEITIDYSTTEMDTLWQMKCNCGSKNCRKIIKSVQFLPEKVYKKYIPFVHTYFMKLYNRTHHIKTK